MFLPNAKGGLYQWRNLRWESELILVEGMFDLAVLWQAGFWNTTCSLGARLNQTQMNQLCDGRPRTVYIVFDADETGGGQRAAWQLTTQLLARGVRALPVLLPMGHDPNSLFCAGATADQFRRLLEAAH
jgi:DNA primase